MKHGQWWALVVFGASLVGVGGCSSDGASGTVSCGDGTVLIDGKCEIRVTCGAGTVLVGGQCEVADGSTGSGGSAGSTGTETGGTGGSSPSTGGTAGIGGEATGGTASGGDAGNGGAFTGGSGGAATGGSAGAATGGSAGAATGGSAGAATGGSAGAATGGSAGAATGGSAGAATGGIGGSATGGDTGSGGAATGGGAGTGGTATGGAGTGGTGGSVGDGILRGSIDCGSRDVTGATVVSGPITQTTTWRGVIHVQDSVSIRNEATLTIEPGTKIIVGLGKEIEFGWEGSHPTVKALGTPDQPIRICGETNRAGYWSRLIVRENVKPESVLRNVLIESGGGTSSGGALVLLAPVLVQGVQVKLSGDYGISAADFATGSAVISAEGARGPVQLTNSRAVTHFPAEPLFQSGTIDLTFTTIDEPVIFHPQPIPYHQGANIAVTSGKGVEMTFEPGVSYQITNRSALDCGDARVLALGSVNAPIRFWDTCLAALYCTTTGGALRIDAVTGTRLENVQLDTLGWYVDNFSTTDVAYAALQISYGPGPIVMKNVQLTKIEGTGIELSNAVLAPDSAGISVTMLSRTSASGPRRPMILTTADVAMNLPADTVVGVDPTRYGPVDPILVSYNSVTASGTLHHFGAPYECPPGLSLSGNAAVTLSPGVELRIGGGSVVSVPAGTSLTATGTATAPVEITSATGTHWGRFDLASSNVSLDYVVVTNGGYGSSPAAAVIARVPILLTHSTISYSSSWGLLKAASDTTDYAATNTFTGNTSGNIGTLP